MTEKYGKPVDMRVIGRDINFIRKMSAIQQNTAKKAVFEAGAEECPICADIKNKHMDVVNSLMLLSDNSNPIEQTDYFDSICRASDNIQKAVDECGLADVMLCVYKKAGAAGGRP